MDASRLLQLYRQMCLCRRFEEAAAKAYSQGKISGFLHLYIGQDAVAVGSISAAELTDYIVATYPLHENATSSSCPQVIAAEAGEAAGETAAGEEIAELALDERAADRRRRISLL
jgi:pyruvate dehydrogenase E1 component alpha subunit